MQLSKAIQNRPSKNLQESTVKKADIKSSGIKKSGIKSSGIKSSSIKAALTIATTALLGAANTAAAQDEDSWDFDTAFLYYSEADRVTAAETIFNANKTFENDEVLNLKLTIDALTGASANGAVAQPNVQTFTRPSGKGQFDVKAGDTPLDDTFKDTRVQFNGQWTQPRLSKTRAFGDIQFTSF
ncbi:MAG: DUF3570 domain-containing protein [Alteromonadaceae bacterium]|nr:DUF3570 domain-containing protein [Alteromonadaceae bacterium]